MDKPKDFATGTTIFLTSIRSSTTMLPKFTLFTIMLFLYLSSSLLEAQDKLFLDNANRLKRIEIEPGDTLRFSLQGEDIHYGGRFKGVKADESGTNWAYFPGDSIKVTEIDELWTRPGVGSRYWTGMVQGAAIMAAIVYPAMILLNRTAVTGYERTDMIEMGVVAGSAITLYLLLKLFHWKKYKLEKDRWKLKVMTPVERL